jgi:hypothetical protein
MSFEDLYETDIAALIERERQAVKVPFADCPELVEKIQKALDFTEIKRQIAGLQEAIYGSRS